MTTFKLKNNDSRTHGFAGRFCIAGSGNPTPEAAAKQVIDGVPFRLPGLFELSEDEMFRSFRGVIASMQTRVVPTGQPAIEVFIDGVPTAFTPAQIEEWAADYRARKGLPEPQNRDDHAKEIERAMNRPEDPLERQERLRQDAQQTMLVKTVTAAVLAVLQGQQEPAKSEEPAPAAQGRARPKA